jgi:hypothetical protein
MTGYDSRIRVGPTRFFRVPSPRQSMRKNRLAYLSPLKFAAVTPAVPHFSMVFGFLRPATLEHDGNALSNTIWNTRRTRERNAQPVAACDLGMQITLTLSL